MSASPSGPELACLRGAAPPPELARDVAALGALPAAARAQLWSVLGPCLAEPLPPGAEQMLDAFAGEHQLSAAALSRPLRACRFLVREAARADLDGAALVRDLRALCGTHAELEAFFLAGYDDARRMVRQQALETMLLDHGDLLVDVDWRVETIEQSSSVARTGVRVALLTLRCRSGEGAKKITIQVLPETLRKLRRAIDEIAP